MYLLCSNALGKPPKFQYLRRALFIFKKSGSINFIIGNEISRPVLLAKRAAGGAEVGKKAGAPA